MFLGLLKNFNSKLILPRDLKSVKDEEHEYRCFGSCPGFISNHTHPRKFINNMQKRHYIAAALLISTFRSLMQVMAVINAGVPFN